MNSQFYRAGDILAVRNYSFMGNKIRKFTNSRLNHTGLFVSPDEIVEATFCGVYKSDLNKFDEGFAKKELDYEVYRLKTVTPAQINMMCNFVLSQVGAKYDFFQLLSIAAFYMFGISRKLDPINIREWWICSELVATAAESAGMKLKTNIATAMMTVQDIVSSELVFKVT